MRPQSIAMTWSAYSTSIMLRPISPSPPSGIRRTAGPAPPADGWSLVSTSSYISGVGCGRAQGVARGVAPGRGPEGARRYPQLEPHRPVELNQDREAAVDPAPWRGRDALGDLALEHQRHLGDRPVGVAESHEDRLRHAVREVAGHEHPP